MKLFLVSACVMFAIIFSDLNIRLDSLHQFSRFSTLHFDFNLVSDGITIIYQELCVCTLIHVLPFRPEQYNF